MAADTYDFSGERIQKGRIEVYEYTQHFLRANSSSPIRANYGLHQVAKDNAKDDETLVKTDQQNF